MKPKKFANTIADLAVGMRVRHTGDLDSGTEGVITCLNPGMMRGGEVQVLTDDRKAEGVTRGRGLYFEGYSANRKWEILSDPSVTDPSDVPAVGDTIRITDVTEGVVKSIDELGRVTLVGTPYLLFPLAAVPHPQEDLNMTRTWAILTKHVPPPAPWQAGDMAVRNQGPLVVRQAGGKWLGPSGADSGLNDANIETRCIVVVRGGVRV